MYRMECYWILVLASAVLALGAANEAKFNGFLGCRFSRVVCQFDEQCIDDNLFGSCQKVGAQEDAYRYHLDRGTLRLLEEDITRLVKEGFTWTSLYTQCVVGNVLLAFRLGVKPDSSWCEEGGAPPARYQEALTDDSRTILADYISDYYNEQPSPADVADDVGNFDVIDVDPYSSPEKKDEFINIHKYLADKRDKKEYRYPTQDEEELYEPFPQMPEYETPSDVEYESRYTDDEGLGDNLNNLVDELRPSDLLLLKSYLRGMDQSEDDEDFVPEGPQEILPEDADMEPGVEPIRPLGEEEEQEASRGYVWDNRDLGLMDGEMPITPSEPMDDMILEPDMVAGPTPDSDYIMSTPQEEELDEDGPSLSPPDAKLLGDLLQDKVDVDSLSDGQIQRLLNHVDNMLYSMEDMQARDQQVEEVKPELPDNNAVQDEESQDKRAEGPIIVETVEPTEALPDPHDHSFDEPVVNPITPAPKLTMLNTMQGYMHVSPAFSSGLQAQDFLVEVENVLDLPRGSLAMDSVKDGDLVFDVSKDTGMDAEMVSKQAMKESAQIQNRTRLTLEDAGVGDNKDKLSVTSADPDRNGPKYFVLTFVLCGSIAGIVLAVIALYIVKRHSRSKEKLKALSAAGDGNEASKDYQDLCRQRMQSKSSEKAEVHQPTRVSSVASESAVRSPSSRSSTSSWSEEPVASNMDISTGHIVLSYMEDHLKNKDRLSEEWEALCAYEAEPSTTTVGAESSNMRKNRYSDVLPYDHSRVILSSTPNVSGSDYINANTITDHDPRNPAYIATQGPLPHTVADFWQMVWEQGSVVIVCLTKLTENGVAMCHRYWPEEGSDLYHIYEVHLVSEHIWCDDYLVRSFYLKNLQTNETRTVTQFHFLTWPDLGIPTSAKSLLDFRRKVNKSYRGRSCPIVVHCSDGVGRTGTYCVIDMVLNRMSKGAKEIDIAATLEHIRDQRANTVKTKEQFEFALASVAEEVHAILKALPQ